MSRHFTVALLGALALAIAGLGAGSATAGPALDRIKDRGYIQIAVANEIPYGFVGATGKAEGIAPSVAQKVLEDMGIKDIQWVVTPFGALIPGLKAGRFDMVAASQAILPARCQQVLYSKPNSSYGEGMLVKKGNPKKIHAYDDFKKNKDLKMAIMSGADQLDFAQGMGIDDAQLVTLTSNSDAPQAVAAGRADAYAATGLTVERLAKKVSGVEAAEPFEDPVVDGKTVRSWGGFTFNKADEDFRDEFNKHLAAFQKTDEYRKIVKHYGLSDHDVDLTLKKTTDELCSG
ncbi:MAG TPA: ectoine/hydroxyectoine ABC transporter substrate-binding protein EhuB [Alphaproteobacteria bacterium]|nr:ectoine/hydroxyectoine ABC transporter substrate-binding protein EhuB [Alphaproteobacteria bacterium]